MIVFLDCNKVSSESFDKVHRYCQSSNIPSSRSSISSFGKKTDILTYADVSSLMSSQKSMKSIVIGDIFWPTGQNICRWCHENGVKVFFWQHGQWIYTTNKRNPRYVPNMIFLLGQNIKTESSKWPLGKRCKLRVTGSPRYDECEPISNDYVYFAPPVILEKSPSAIDKYHAEAKRVIDLLSGLDSEVRLHIHPHYREGNIDYLRKMFPRAVFHDVNDNPLDIISHCSAVLTHRNSTSVLDAIACHKKVVLVNFDKLSSYFPKNYFGDFALESDNPDHCLFHLMGLPQLDDEDYELNARSHILLGNASNRIVREILLYN